MNVNELYSDIVREYSQSNHNFKELATPSVSTPGKNPSCGDEIHLQLQVEGGKITDGAYTGVGCAISKASTSLMIDLVKGKTVAQAREMARLFLKMSQRQEMTQEELDLLEEAVALQNVSNMPARVKCATMPWHTLDSALASLEG